MTDIAQTEMADFVFGGIEADENRLLASERAARSTIRHFHQIEPLDPASNQPVTLTVQVGPDVTINRMTAYYTTDGSDPSGAQGGVRNGYSIALSPSRVRWEPLIWAYVTLWQGQIPAQPDGTLVQYRIEGWRTFDTPVSIWSREMNIDRTLERPVLYGYHVDNYAVPRWAKEAIVYQIFVDRFAGVENRWLEPGEMNDFAGGTLHGVTERLDYIAGLGVTTIWLTPVFETESYHGYDTSDYLRVDPRFGTNDDLVALFDAAHSRGLRVILDFVANHTSTAFAPFSAALADPASEYRPWFTFDDQYKHGYRAFFDIASMPQLDTDNRAVRDYLCAAAQYWLKAGADGLRLDYAAGPSHVFWSVLRAACRGVKPDCWLFGEVTRAGDFFRVYSGRLDGCLDFAFCRAVRMLCSHKEQHLSLGHFLGHIVNQRRYFGDDYTLPSFIDNHDMNRFLWVAGNDQRRLRLALGLLFALGGSPTVYYGTEVGLSQPRTKGPWREESRHPMLWGKAQDADLLDYFRRLTGMRRSHPAFVYGAIQTLMLDEERSLWLGERADGPDRVLIAVNLHQKAQTVNLPAGNYTDLYDTQASGSVALPPLGIALLSAANITQA